MSAAYWLDVEEENLPDDVYGYIRHGARVFTVPILPYVEIDDDAVIQFHGPLYYNVYGCLKITPRGGYLYERCD